MGKKIIIIFLIAMTACKEVDNTTQANNVDVCQFELISAFFQEDLEALEAYTNQEINRVSLGKHEEPLINYAVSKCNTKMILYLVNRNINLGAVDSLGRTPYMIALDQPCLEAMLLIIASQDHIYHDDAGGDHELFEKEVIDIAKKIEMGKSDMNVVGQQDHLGFINEYFGWDLLMYSLLYNNEEYARKLINAGYDVNKADHEHNTPLSIAAKVDNRRMFDELIRFGAKIDAKTPEEQEIIYWSKRRNFSLAER